MDVLGEKIDMPKKAGCFMHIDDVIDRQILPEPIFDKYAIIEKSFGMFSDGKLSS